MIAQLRGVPAGHDDGVLVLDVSGVGYAVHATSDVIAEASRSDAEIVVHTYQHVREDALQLFGFASHAERAAFEKLDVQFAFECDHMLRK